MSLRADTLHNPQSSFFPPSKTIHTAHLSSSRPAQVSAQPDIASFINLDDMDPAKDDYKLRLQGRRAHFTMALEQEEFLWAPVDIPPLPWGVDGRSRNIWSKGSTSKPTNQPSEGEELSITNAQSAKIENILSSVLSLPSSNQKIRADPKSTQDEPPLICPIVDLPDELKGLTVNQIFALSLEKCLAKGKIEEEKQARNSQQRKEDEDEDKKSACSLSSSEACSEDLPFISSVNILSMRKREAKRVQNARLARDAELGITLQASSSSASSPAGNNVNVCDTSFASANSDPEPADDMPLFTIRSKKAPIKIVDPRTLQRPDKPKTAQDLVKDLDFLRRGLRVLGTGGDLIRDAYNMFKTVGMDTMILGQTSKWQNFIQSFVRDCSATLRDVKALKKVEFRTNIYESIGQMMQHKKKIDNSMLGWTNFAISMFPVTETSDGLRFVFELDESADEKRSPNVAHMHSKACQEMNHELQKLTEGNRLKFKTLLAMLIESLSECKDWILKAPSYSKAKSLKVSEFKPIDGFTIPSIGIEPPKEHGTGKEASSKSNSFGPKVKAHTADRVNVKIENETKATITSVNTVGITNVKSQLEPDERGQGQRRNHHNQQTEWYPPSYATHGCGYQQMRVPGGDFVQHSGVQVIRPQSALSQSTAVEGYHQSHGNNRYQHETTNKHVQRTQHSLPRGRQGARSGVQSRSGSTGVRQSYGGYHGNLHASQPHTNIPNVTPPSGPVNDFHYNSESGAYQEARYAYPQHQQGHQQSIHQQSTHQPPQQWRSGTVNPSDNGYTDANQTQQYPASNSGQNAEQIIGSGGFIRQQDRNAETSSSQRGGTMTPQILQHSGLLHHPSSEQYHHPSNQQVFTQGGNAGMYSRYTHATWQTGHSHQLHQQQAAQARGQKQGPPNLIEII
ncbi:hypothetical protein TWF694_005540 [Orbilia ellipsospora]|uniref:Uncharacterized protein n=1 Tax=Orbilia ellipsospora TaxID=2528407 RepID=A0AAV9WUH1_9PEZI